MKIIDSDKNSVIKILRDGVDSEFWKLIEQALDETLEGVEKLHLLDQEAYEDLTAEECKFRIGVFNMKKRYLKELKDLPKTIANSFAEPEQIDQAPDVYHSKEDFIPKM